MAGVELLRTRDFQFVLNLCLEGLTECYTHQCSMLAAAEIHMLLRGDLSACNFIATGVRHAGVLVNCWGGVNRSAAVFVAFCVARQNKEVEAPP